MEAKRSLSLLLALVMILSAVCVTSMSSCGKKGTPGEKTITVKVTDKEGKETSYTIRTDEEFLRGALEQEKLIEGHVDGTMFYVDKVLGVAADWNTDHAYWAFYKGGEYLNTGVAETAIKDGDSYEITYTKG